MFLFEIQFWKKGTKFKLNTIDLNNYLFQITTINNENDQKKLTAIDCLQESLVIFYSHNVSETKTFIDFLVNQLTSRQRPTSLIVQSIQLKLQNEIDITEILKYAWQKKFLNFPIIATDYSVKTTNSSTYYSNPINDIFYLNVLDKHDDLFPDKLSNPYGYPLYVFLSLDYNSGRRSQPNRRLIE